MSPNDADGMANSVDPDQTAPEELIWVCTVCKEIFLKLVANDRSDKTFLLISKFCSLGVSAPELQLYTFTLYINSSKDVYKVRG